MRQGVLAFQYQQERVSGGMTALAGLPAYLELMEVAGVRESIARNVRLRADSQGWTDGEVLIALLLLNLAGGEAVDDLRLLEADEGFCRVLRESRWHGRSGGERRRNQRRWRKHKQRSVPSPSAVFRYLAGFHDEREELKRVAGSAFVPRPGEGLRGLARVNAELLAFVQRHAPSRIATLDMDATLVESDKQQALYSYQKTRAYQPLSSYWFEQDLLVASEFRDGNVPAGFEQVRVLTEALAHLPPGVERVRLRSDTAGYQRELLKYCAEGRSERFKVIEFAVGVDVTAAFKRAVREVPEGQWQPLTRQAGGQEAASGQQWAEVGFIPNWAAHSQNAPEYRFLAIREPLRQPPLLSADTGQQAPLPFPTLELPESGWHKLFGLITNNLEAAGDELIHWSRQRCGNSEQAHAVLKDDLAGGQLPSAHFGVNAAWWQVALLAFNLNTAMKRLALGERWHSKRLKAIRFTVINLPGRVIPHARSLIIRLSAEHPCRQLLLTARHRILALAHGPPATAPA